MFFRYHHFELQSSLDRLLQIMSNCDNNIHSDEFNIYNTHLISFLTSPETLKEESPHLLLLFLLSLINTIGYFGDKAFN